MSAEMVVPEDAARRLTKRIQLRLDTIADNVEAVVPLITEARTSNVHQTLGYRSWTEYVSSEFGGRLTRLTKAERQPLVEMFSEQGMSTRAIAPIVGVSQKTVVKDLQVIPQVSPDPEAENRQAMQDLFADPTAVAEMARLGETTTKKITGVDGKRYTKREARKQTPEPMDKLTHAVFKVSKASQDLLWLTAPGRRKLEARTRDGCDVILSIRELARVATRFGLAGDDGELASALAVIASPRDKS